MGIQVDWELAFSQQNTTEGLRGQFPACSIRTFWTFFPRVPTAAPRTSSVEKMRLRDNSLRYPGSRPTNLRKHNSLVTSDRVKMNQETRFKQKKPPAGSSLKWRASRSSASCMLCYSPLLICSVVCCAAAVGLQCGPSLPRPGLPPGATSRLRACRQPGDQEPQRGAPARRSREAFASLPPAEAAPPEML